jgi:hypothetical protein
MAWLLFPVNSSTESGPEYNMDITTNLSAHQRVEVCHITALLPIAGTEFRHSGLVLLRRVDHGQDSSFDGFGKALPYVYDCAEVIRKV